MTGNSQALAQGLQGYNFMLTPQANVSMRQIQQEQALADALRSQGDAPIDTNNRSIGGVGYAISPFEGAAKLSQALVGALAQRDANSKYNDLVSPQPDASQQPPPSSPEPDLNTPAPPGGGGITSTPSYPGDAPQMPPQVGAAGFQQLPAPPQPQAAQQPAPSGAPGFINPQYTAALQAVQQKYNLTPFEAQVVMQDPSALGRVISSNAPTPEMKNATMAYGAAGAPGAVRNIMDLQQFPGQKSMQEGLGTAAAQQAPAGSLPPGPGGIPNPPPRPAPSFPPQPSGYSVQNDGIHLPNPPPPSVGGLPPAAMATLQNAANPAGGAQPPAPDALPPINRAGMSNAEYNEAVKARGAGASAQATKTGDNAAEAAKTFNVMAANLPVLQKRIAAMTEANKSASFGPWNDEAGDGIASKYHDAVNDKASVANATLQQLTAQNVLPELGPALAQAGIRGNKFLEQLSTTASGVDLSHGTGARQQQIDGLLQNYIQNMKSTYQQVKTYGGDPGGMFPDPAAIANAVKIGVIPRDEGIQLLQKNHGMQ